MADISPSNSQGKRPWLLTTFGLVSILILLLLPVIAILPAGDKLPDTVRFIGHFHPLLLHLPIGVFVLILFQELGLWLCKKRRHEAPAEVGFAVIFGALSAILAVLAGYLLLRSGGADYEGNDLAQRHLWGGVVFAVMAIATVVVKSWSVALGARPRWHRWMVILSVGVMCFAGHDGASLTHGSGYLTEYAPGPIRKLLGLKAAGVKDTSDPVVFEDVIHPILERRCVQCHKEGKAKGRLRMETYDLLLTGGKGGAAIKPGDSAKSAIVERMTLPTDDDEHMPPEGKPPVGDDELLVIKWWIDQGASPKSKLSEVTLPTELKAVIAGLLERPKDSTDSKAGGSEVVGHTQPDNALKSKVAALGQQFPGAVNFESQESLGVTLSAVSLRGKLTDTEFVAFAPVIPNLVSADLSATKISDKSVALLAKAKQLKMLRLSETEVTDGAIQSLLQVTTLESLNLYGTKVTDAGVLKLAGLSQLKRLYLWQTSVSPDAIKQLQEKLPKCQIVTGAVTAVTK